MTGNPLEPDPERDARIQARAQRLWEQEGRPKGREADYLERARELIGMEEHPQAGLKPNPIAQGEQVARPIVEEAEIQANLGEFPGSFTDQGDRAPTPAPRRRRD